MRLRRAAQAAWFLAILVAAILIEWLRPGKSVCPACNGSGDIEGGHGLAIGCPYCGGEG